MKFLILLVFIMACSGPRYTRKQYPWKPRVGQSFIGHNGYGVGILKDKDTLFIGRFTNGFKNGIFKVIYPNGNYVYRYYEKNHAFSYLNNIGSFLVLDGKKYLSFSHSDYLEKALIVNDESIVIKNYSFKAKKEEDISLSKLEVSPSHLNQKSTKTSNFFYTKAGQTFQSYKYEKGWYYGTYKDIFGTKLYHKFKFSEKKLKDRSISSLINKEFDIEFSKIKTKDWIYQGETRKGQLHGFGALDKSGETIIGFFKNGKANGSAKFIDKDGKVFNGFFKDGKKHGAFIFLYQRERSQLVSAQVDLNYIDKLDKEFAPIEKWYNLGAKGKKPEIKVPSTEEFKQNRGSLSLIGPQKMNIKPVKQAIQSYAVLDLINFNKAWNQQVLGVLEHDYDWFYRSFYRDTFAYHFYKDDRLITKGNISKKANSKCMFNLKGTTRKLYANDCVNPLFYYSSYSEVIQDPEVENNEIISGYYAKYNFQSLYGYNGPFINAKLNGEGIDFYKRLRGKYKNGKVYGKAFSYYNNYPAYGNYQDGKREGKFWIKTNALNEYRYGKYSNDKAQGKFKIINFDKDLTGSVNFKDGKREGLSIRKWNKDGTIFTKLYFKGDKLNGKGICNIKNKREDCEFKNGKRVDQVYQKRVSKREAKLAAEKRAKEQRLQEERRLREAQARRRREKAREDKLRRQRNAQLMMQNYQNSINSIKNTVPATNYNPNYYNQKYQKKSTSTNPSTRTNQGSTLTLTATKPYKECILQENYKGNLIKVAYNCNDRAGTFPKAQKTMNDNKAWYDREEQKRIEAQKRSQEMLDKKRSQMEKVCNEFFAKNGNYCMMGCDPKIYDKSNCKTLSR